MSVRTSNLTNFKGEKLATENFVDKKINLPEGVDSVIDAETNKLSSELNPIAVASMQNATGTTDFSKLKIIGDCSVIYGANGLITLRIGPALNSSLFNGLDGISKATATYAKSGNETATMASSFGATSTNVTKESTDNFTVKCGTTATTATAAGNAVHFEDNVNGKFKVTIFNGTSNDEVIVGPITTSTTYKVGGASSNAIECAITNFKAEPKISSGANGYCGNVNFTFYPDKYFSGSTNYRVVKIEQLEGNDVVATWTNTDNIVYFHLNDTTTPATPTGASYTLTKDTKVISGITYLTTSSKVNPSATGMANIGFPGAVTNKANCSPSGGTWFTGFNETATTAFTTWTDVKGTTMSWSGTGASLLIGKWDNPQISVKGTNINGSGTAKTSAETNNAIYVCDSNGYVSTTHGSFKDASRLKADFATAFASVDLTTSGNTDLQTFNGYIQYPNFDFSGYNKNGATAVNKNYGNCTGTRYAYLKLSKTGTIMGGTFKFDTVASPKAELEAKTIKIELANSTTGAWMDLLDIATTFSYGTSNSIGFSIPQASNYGSGYLLCKITMNSTATTQIGSVSLA